VTPARDQSFRSRFIVDAELAVLAMPLLDPGRTAEVAVALEPADFADEANRTIYAAMLRLHSAGTPIDVALVVGELCDRGQYGAEDVVSAATLVELFRPAPLPQYLSRVLEISRRRCLRA
jgi:replicative DNA helicase